MTESAPRENDEHEIGRSLCVVVGEVHKRGWCLGTSGNFSVTLEEQPLRLLITQSGLDTGRLGPEDLVVVGPDAQPVAASYGGEAVSDRERLRGRFDAFAEGGEIDAARAFGAEILRSAARDPRFLNNLAWALLTEKRYGGAFDALALELSRASNEETGNGVWQYLDTLALASFRSGDVKAAVELEERAIRLAKEDA